jgi:lipopolysaccharide export LptBFGC system permease protein LptF
VAYLLDIVGSIVIGSIVVLIILLLNLNIISSSGENLNTNTAQMDLTTTVWVVEYDLYKIGYRVGGSKISIADSNQIKFYTDLDNDGNKDSIHYYLGNTSEFNSTSNPLDKPLYRQENDTTVFRVVDFNIVYHDSSGSRISYSDLTNQASRDLVKTLTVALAIESGEPIEGKYQISQWEKKITPKNLR